MMRSKGAKEEFWDHAEQRMTVPDPRVTLIPKITHNL